MTGVSALKGNTIFHPFLWTQQTGIQDLGVLPGDLVGAGLGMNNKGVVVGASISAPGPASGNPRAFVRQNGVMSDLNALVPPDAPFHLLTANAINDQGQIVRFGVTSNGEIHAFLAFPSYLSSTGATTTSHAPVLQDSFGPHNVTINGLGLGENPATECSKSTQ